MILSNVTITALKKSARPLGFAGFFLMGFDGIELESWLFYKIFTNVLNDNNILFLLMKYD